MSMKVPSTSSSTLIISRMMRGFSEIASMQVDGHLRDLEVGHQPAEGAGHADDQQHHRGGAHRPMVAWTNSLQLIER